MKKPLTASTLKRLHKTFGRRVQEIRLKRKFSKTKLADLAGVHRSYIAVLESGESNCNVLTVFRLAKALRVTAADLLR